MTGFARLSAYTAFAEENSLQQKPRQLLVTFQSTLQSVVCLVHKEITKVILLVFAIEQQYVGVWD